MMETETEIAGKWKFSRDRFIREGTFGSTYYLGWESDNRNNKVAICVVEVLGNEKFGKLLESVLLVWKEIECEFVLGIHHYEKRNNDFIIVSESIPCSVEDYIKENGGFGGGECFERFCFQMKEALRCLRDHRIVHRDIKPASILMSTKDLKKCTFKLSCLDCFCCVLERNQIYMKTCSGSPFYVAPEILSHRGMYTSNVDIWSLGIVFYEVLIGRVPFLATTFIDLYMKLLEIDKNLSFPTHVDPMYVELIRKMLDPPWKNRMTLKEFVLHFSRLFSGDPNQRKKGNESDLKERVDYVIENNEFLFNVNIRGNQIGVFKLLLAINS